MCCYVCVEWEAGNLTSKEALRAIGELVQTATSEETMHYFEVSDKILDKEVPLNDVDTDLDQNWYEENHDGE